MSRFIFLLAVAAYAQTPDTATIHGRVTDPSHAAVAQVQVKVTNALTNFERSVQTGENGDFNLAGLPIAGTYTITANKAGFAETKLENLALTGGTTAQVDLQMNVAAAQSQVTVTGAAGEVRTDSPQLGDTLDAHQIEETPLLNRRITYLPLLNAANRPAINQGDVFMNQICSPPTAPGRRQTWFEVDGGTDNDSWGRQTIVHQHSCGRGAGNDRP